MHRNSRFEIFQCEYNDEAYDTNPLLPYIQDSFINAIRVLLTIYSDLHIK